MTRKWLLVISSTMSFMCAFAGIICQYYFQSNLRSRKSYTFDASANGHKEGPPISIGINLLSLEIADGDSVETSSLKSSDANLSEIPSVENSDANLSEIPSVKTSDANPSEIPSVESSGAEGVGDNNTPVFEDSEDVVPLSTKQIKLFADGDINYLNNGTYWIKVSLPSFYQNVKRYMGSYSYKQLHVEGSQNITNDEGCETADEHLASGENYPYPAGYMALSFFWDKFLLLDAYGDPIKILSGKELISLESYYRDRYVLRTPEELTEAKVVNWFENVDTPVEGVPPWSIDNGRFINWMQLGLNGRKDLIVGKFTLEEKRQTPLTLMIWSSYPSPDTAIFTVFREDFGTQKSILATLLFILSAVHGVFTVHLVLHRSKCIDRVLSQ